MIDGQVGIQAIAPGLRAFGLGCIALPTTLLAAHPAAYPQAHPPAGGALPAAQITEFAEWLLSAGAFENLAGVLTGYMPSVEHVEATAGVIDLLRAQKPSLPVCCDPICGDHDQLYLPQEVATALGEHLLPRASIATPNLFELGHLAGTARSTKPKMPRAQRYRLNVPEVIVTSAPGPKGRIATLLVSDQLLRCETIAVPQVPHGMGDLFPRSIWVCICAKTKWPGHCNLNHGKTRGQKCQQKRTAQRASRVGKSRASGNAKPAVINIVCLKVYAARGAVT